MSENASASAGPHVYDFGPFRLDVAERLLLRDGHPVALTPKAFDLLVYLVERPGHLVEKSTLMSVLWPDTIVEEANLAFQISALRKVLDDGGNGESLIQTIPTKGYRFVAAATPKPTSPSRTEPGSRSWSRSPVVWAAAAVVLILCAVAVAVQMSRAHARPGPPAVLEPENIHSRKLTDNDTAMDAAISPDGRYVVFVREQGGTQSLWLRQIDTRTDVRIVAADGTQFHGLTVSPDSTLIYYVKSHPDDPFARSLYSMSILGGPARMVLKDIDGPISFSPDGKQFAYEHCEDTGLQIRIARMDSDNERQVGVIHDAECGVFQLGPRWSPDGRTIVVPAVIQEKQQLWILAGVSVEDGTVRTLFESLYAIGRPVWIAGGQALLVPHSNSLEDFNRLQLWTVTFPGGEARRVTDDLTMYDIALDATPDGRMAVARVQTLVSNIWVVPADDPVRSRQVTDGLPLWVVTELEDGRLLADGTDGKLWSMAPDGTQRVPFSNLRGVNTFVRCGNHIVASVETPGTVTYVRLDMDGTHATPLIGGNLPIPVSCAESGEFVFYVRYAPTPLRIFKVPLAGGAPVEVGHDLPVGAVFPLSVSPDETQLAYLEKTEAPGVPEGWRVAVVRIADGSAVASWAVRLPASYPQHLRWSHDGLVWQFLRAEGDTFNVWEQALPDGAPKQLTRFTSGRIFTWTWSPDGKRLVMARGSRNHDVVLLNLQ